MPSADRKLIRISYIDITGRKQAEDEVLQLNRSWSSAWRQRTAALEQANSELEWFSYSVSHDLRAPLRAINGYTRILQEDEADRLDHEGARYLQQIRESAARMERLIERPSRLFTHGAPGNRDRDVDVAALSAKCSTSFAQRRPTGGIDLS